MILGWLVGLRWEVKEDVLFPSDWAWRMRMIRRGLAMMFEGLDGARFCLWVLLR